MHGTILRKSRVEKVKKPQGGYKKHGRSNTDTAGRVSRARQDLGRSAGNSGAPGRTGGNTSYGGMVGQSQGSQQAGDISGVSSNDASESNVTSIPVSQNITSADTSIKQIPALFKDKNARFGDVNVDIGGGRFDLATEYLRGQGTENLVFDPYNRSEEVNSATLKYLQDGNRADTATCANVLNVIAEPEARANVILEAAKAIKPDGTAYFMVF